MNKNRKQDLRRDEKEDHARHYFNIKRKAEDKRMMRNLDRALRNKDYERLVRSDEY